MECATTSRERGGRGGRERAIQREREETDGAVVHCRLSIRGWGRIERERDETDGAVVQCRLSIRGWGCNVVYPPGGVIANQPPSVSTLRVI